MALASQILSHKLKIFSKNPKNRFSAFLSAVPHLLFLSRSKSDLIFEALFSVCGRRLLFAKISRFCLRLSLLSLTQRDSCWTVLIVKPQLSGPRTLRTFLPQKLSDSFIINPLQIWLPVSDGTWLPRKNSVIRWMTTRCPLKFTIFSDDIWSLPFYIFGGHS